MGAEATLTNVADLVTRAAARTPDAAAVVFSDRTVTWSEQERLMRAFAGGLAARGLHQGDRVAMLVGNSPEFLTAYFGALRAGMVVVPINPGFTAFEVEYLVSQSKASLLISDPDTHRVAVEAAGAVPVVRTGSEAWRRLMVGSTPPPPQATDPEDLAVLMFTSGTSGRPKGAMLSHRALLANLDQLTALVQPAAVMPSDVVLILLPLSHSYALNGGLGLVAYTGATAVITNRTDPVSALRLIATHGVTVVATAPPVYVAWAQQPDIAAALADVRLLVSGAAPLSRNLFVTFEDATGQPVWEGYGMTEASPVITSTLASGTPVPGSVGKPLPGIELRVVDNNGADVDEGDPGEVVIRGANLFSGYWPDGVDGPDDEGWWATSDVGIIDGDGDLRLVDRRNDLIIVSGFNVYPREVEDVLMGMPGVAEVAVMGIPHPYTGETVKAVVVASEELDSEQVLQFCQTRLARFKCPTVVEFVASLPHSGTGKVSKGALRSAVAE